MMNFGDFMTDVDEKFKEQVFWSINQMIMHDIWIPFFRICKYWADLEIYYLRQLLGFARIYYYPHLQKFTLDVTYMDYPYCAIQVCHLLKIEPELYDNEKEKEYRTGQYQAYTFDVCTGGPNTSYYNETPFIQPICFFEHTSYEDHMTSIDMWYE